MIIHISVLLSNRCLSDSSSLIMDENTFLSNLPNSWLLLIAAGGWRMIVSVQEMNCVCVLLEELLLFIRC